MSAVVGAQHVSSKLVGADVPFFSIQLMSVPQLARKADLTPAQLEVLDLVREDIRAASSIQPMHRMLANASWSPTINNPADEIVDELAGLNSSKIPLAVKAFVVGAGLAAAALFASNNILPSPDNKFAGALIGLITLLSLPIVSAEFTGRSLRKEFELIPLESDNLPSLREILDRGCTPERFGTFVEMDLLPRVPTGHARALAGDCGTSLHDITFWGRDDLHFQNTTWETVHNVISRLGVGDDISLRVKAALLVIERDTTLDEASLPKINAALEALASIES